MPVGGGASCEGALTLDPPPNHHHHHRHHHHPPVAQPPTRALVPHGGARCYARRALPEIWRCVCVCVMWLHSISALTCRAHCRHNPLGFKGECVCVCVLFAHTHSSVSLAPCLCLSGQLLMVCHFLFDGLSLPPSLPLSLLPPLSPSPASPCVFCEHSRRQAGLSLSLGLTNEPSILSPHVEECLLWRVSERESSGERGSHREREGGRE